MSQTYFGTLNVERCCSCGIVFGLDAEYQRLRREDHGWFYCPAGHSQHYTGQTEAAKLRDELAREKHRTEQAQAEAARQRGVANMKERQLRARKGQVTKLRNRIEKGVCPCCDRYFANVHAHMTNQHPDWKPDELPDDRIGEIEGRRGPDLRALREAKGWTRAKFAKVLGIKTSSVHAYESTNSRPPQRAFDVLETEAQS